ncbi:MAG: VIT domain-containing protein [Massilia sp.]
MLMRLFAMLAALLLAANAYAQSLVPFRLITSGQVETPIALQRLSIGAELSGALAETTVKMVFHNPNGRPLEGNLQFPLLDGQHITAFALDIEGEMRPAVPVEKAKGRAVFEAIERRNVDPGLLEVTQGNNFKLRIFPIPAHGTRTVEIKYAEPLTRHERQWEYRLPLAYGQVGDFELALKVNGGSAQPVVRGGLSDLRFEQAEKGWQARFSRQSFAVAGVLNVGVDASTAPRVYRQQRAGVSYFLAEIPVASTPARRAAPRTIGLLWDSSGSGINRAREAELAELDRYFRALGQVDVRLIRLRDRADKPLNFRIRGGDWSALRRELEATVYDGASALADWQAQSDVDQYLLFSDGLVNYGAARFPTLGASQRLFALNSSASADSARLAAIAAQGGGALIEIDPAKPGAAARALLYEEARVDQFSATGATDLVFESRNAVGGMLRVAGRLLSLPGQLSLGVVNGGKTERIEVPLDSAMPDHPLAATTWANLKLRALEADFEAHRGEIGRLGRQFGIPTRETSLIVLERLDDYLRYDIEPPEKYAAAYKQLRMVRGNGLAQNRSKHIESVLRMFEQRVAWWERPFPKQAPKPVFPEMKMMERSNSRMVVDSVVAEDVGAMPSMAMSLAAPPPPPSPAPAPRAGYLAAERAPAAARMRKSSQAEPSEPQIGVSLTKWVPNAPYIARLRAAPADKVYALYLDEKPSYPNSSAFMLDVADILIDKGQRDLALRVLSNLAEMDLENRAILRILGYRLMQAGAPGLAVPVFEKVLRLAEEEPQSWRDLGLAQAAAGETQKAVDALYEVVLRPWDDRFPEIENIALAEMNAIIAGARKPLDVSRIDPRLRKNLPLDLRVVLAWDADNSDMDLWVTDPDGEKASYANPLSRQGGRMSRDFTQGYGPEEFSLREAKPGKYRIEANYYGNRQQVLAGATTLQVKLFSAFGTPRQKEQVITLRLKDRGETVYVGEFEVPTSAPR